MSKKSKTSSKENAVGTDERPIRADAQRNLNSILAAARELFTTVGVDAPVRDIAEKAGVGLGTLYRHFPDRTALIVAVFKHEVDACAGAAARLAKELPPGDALIKWLGSYSELIATKRGLAPALHSGDAAYTNLRDYFTGSVHPSFKKLLESAIAAREIRSDVNADEILPAVASLCMSSYMGKEHTKRMVALLADGLRYNAKPTSADG